MSGTYIDELLQQLTARLHQLELQAGRKGIDAPPEVVIEIENLRAQIQQVEMGSKSLISVELLERMEPAERWKRLYDSVWEVELILYTLQKNVDADRMRLQARHKEFNTAVQGTIFENALLKQNVRRLNVALFSVCIISLLFAYIQLYFR